MTAPCAGFVWCRWVRPGHKHHFHFERYVFVNVMNCERGNTTEYAEHECCRCGKVKRHERTWR